MSSLDLNIPFLFLSALEENEIQTAKHKITMNDQLITDSAVEWAPWALQHQINILLKDEPITSIRYESVDSSAATINEVFSLFAQQNIPDSGLEELILSNLKGLDELDNFD